MHILDNISKIKQLDKSNMLGSIEALDKQIKQAWEEAKRVKIPKDYQTVNKVVVNGMGGSGLGAHIIQTVFMPELKVPLGKIHGYDLPGAVDDKTLYIISSYSGDTEEPLAGIKLARRRGAKILGIASGGQLGRMIDSGEMPGYRFRAKYNPSNQPRMGLGYSVAGQLGLLQSCGIITIKGREMDKALGYLGEVNSKFGAGELLKENICKQIAGELKGKIPVIVVADFLYANAHVMANQLNENAKNFSYFAFVSELNHYLMEGLSFPSSNPDNLIFLFIGSGLYHKKNIKRMIITKEVVEKNKIKFMEVKLGGENKLEQCLEMMLAGSYISFYLAMLNGIDPSPIPWVDYFKNQLAKN